MLTTNNRRWHDVPLSQSLWFQGFMLTAIDREGSRSDMSQSLWFQGFMLTRWLTLSNGERICLNPSGFRASC